MHLGIVDDLVGDVDGLVWEMGARLVGHRHLRGDETPTTFIYSNGAQLECQGAHTHRPLNPPTEAVVLCESHCDVPSHNGALVSSQLSNQR